MSEFDFKPNPKSISEEEWDRRWAHIFEDEENVQTDEEE